MNKVVALILTISVVLSACLSVLSITAGAVGERCYISTLTGKRSNDGQVKSIRLKGKKIIVKGSFVKAIPHNYNVRIDVRNFL